MNRENYRDNWCSQNIEKLSAKIKNTINNYE